MVSDYNYMQDYLNSSTINLDLEKKLIVNLEVGRGVKLGLDPIHHSRLAGAGSQKAMIIRKEREISL